MLNKVYFCCDEEFKELVKSSSSMSEVITKLGYKDRTSMHARKLFKQRVDELAIPLKHFNQTTYKLDEVLTKDSPISNSTLKLRLVNEHLIDDSQCAICKMKTNWNGKPIVLQLDHINGNNKDNSLSNLRLICPNCHSQTPTFAGRNKEGYSFNQKYCLFCNKPLTIKGVNKSFCTNHCYHLHLKQQAVYKLVKPKMLVACSNNEEEGFMEDKPTRMELKVDLFTMSFEQVVEKHNITLTKLKKWMLSYNLSTKKSDYKK